MVWFVYKRNTVYIKVDPCVEIAREKRVGNE